MPTEVLKGTTPTLIIPIAGQDWTKCTIYLSIVTAERQIILDSDKLLVTCSEGTTSIAVLLSQGETLAMASGKARGEVKAISADGNVVGTYKFFFDVLPTDIPYIIKYKGGGRNG